MQPFTEVSSSSHKRWSRRRGDRRSVRSCLPEMADIYSAKGWCPKRQNGKSHPDRFFSLLFFFLCGTNVLMYVNKESSC